MLTVGDILRTDCLAGGKLLAGGNGLGRRVTRVTVMEVPDYHQFINPGELVLTTGYGVKDDRRAQLDLVPNLFHANAAALAVKCRWIPRVDPEMLAAADRLGLPVIELPSELPWSTLVDSVTRVILRAHGAVPATPESADMRVIEALGADGNASALVEQLGVLLGAVTLVSTPTGSLLLGPFGANPPLSIEQLMHAWSQDESEVKTWNAISLATLHVNDLQIIRARVPVPVQGRERPELCVLFIDEPPGESLRMIERTAEALSRLLGNDERHGTERKHLSRFFQLWLSGMGGSADQIKAQAGLLGYAVPSKHYLLYLQVDGDPSMIAPNQISRIANYMSMYLSSQDAGDLVSEVADGVLFLVAVRTDIPSEWPRQHGQTVLQAVQNRWPQLRFSMAVGPVVEQLDEVPSTYKDLGITLQIRRVFGLADPVICEPDIRLYRLLYGLHASTELHRFLKATTGRLVEHDRDNRSELLNTLTRFLQCGRNIRETAAGMFTHYNTIRYRLRQIEKLTGRLLDNAEHCFELELAVRLRAAFSSSSRTG